MASPNITLGSETMTLLLFNTNPSPAIGASVLYANPTATAYVLNCLNQSDTAECGTYNYSVTVGNWAPKTSSSGSSSSSTTSGMATGIYDAYNEIPSQSARVSIHCGMNGTVPGICTSTQNIGYAGRGATATATVVTQPASTFSPLSWSYQTVSLVGGQEKLAAASTATDHYTTSTAMRSSSGSRAASATATSSHAAGSAVAAQASASSTKSSGAEAYGPGMGSVALAAVVLSWFVR
ncbi:hypothetical protein MBLNU457_6305t1 [Dothideomycetes sp. NU457]